MLRVCQSCQSITNQAHLIPLTCYIRLGPDLTIFISDSSIFQSSDFAPTVLPNPSSHHHNSVPAPPQLHLTLNITISPRSYLRFLQI